LIAIDMFTGEVTWTFDLVPVDEQDTARDTWSPYPPERGFGVGGASAWNAGAYDPATGTIVFGTGQPIPSDQLDPRRFDGDGPVTADLYTSSFVAIDASSGKLKWYQQVVPGDEWGYDQHTVPLIIDLDLGDGPRRVAILATTTGFLLVVDLDTGELLSASGFIE